MSFRKSHQISWNFVSYEKVIKQTIPGGRFVPTLGLIRVYKAFYLKSTAKSKLTS